MCVLRSVGERETNIETQLICSSPHIPQCRTVENVMTLVGSSFLIIVTFILLRYPGWLSMHMSHSSSRVTLYSSAADLQQK